MLSFMLTQDGLTFIANCRPISIAKDHEKFDKVLAKLREGAEPEDLVAIIEEEKRAIEEAIKAADGQLTENLEIRDGVLRYKTQVLHLYVADKLVEMVRQGFEVSPVVNFIERLMKNPSHRAVNHLYAFLEHGKNPLTPDGKFIAYKAVREDWKDIHSGTFDNSVGAEVEMPRWQVDEDPNRTCSAGLHACSFDYLPHFSHANGHIILVEIDPADVVAIPVDYNNTKMRVCKYRVIGEYEGYYKAEGNLLAGSALYASRAFAVESRRNDDEDFQLEDSFDTLLQAAACYEDLQVYQKRIINTTSGKVVDEVTDEAYEEDSVEEEIDEPTYNVYAYENLSAYNAGEVAEQDEDFGTEEQALDKARDLMDDYSIVEVRDSNGCVIKTYGYTG